ncbi:MAG: response regulator [Betaproteobacteria bacterium]|nr:response regulator [Betaproteobacteria bacterium]
MKSTRRVAEHRLNSSAPFHAIILGILLLCGSLLAVAETAMTSDGAVEITAALTEAPLIPWARIVKDPDRNMTAEELLKLPATANAPKGNRIASFGFSDAAYWFSVSLDNTNPAPLQRLLVLEPTWLDDVQVTLIQADGARQVYEGGDSLPFKHRAIPHRQINFELTLPPGRNRLLVRTQTRDPFLVGMTLWERSAFFESDSWESKYLGLIYGAIGAMLLFNLVLFFSVREKIYAAYVGYLSGFLLMHTTYNGHMFPLLWPDSPAWGNWAHSIFIYLFLLAGVFFAIYFLDLRTRQFHAYRWAVGFILAMLASSVVTALWGGYGLHVSTSILWIIIYSPFVLLLGILSLSAGNRAARFFLTATVAGFIGSFITAATVSGLIPFSFYGYRAVDLGMLVDAVLLSLALADRLRLSRAEAEQAKSELIETTRSHAQQLEETVAQRTLELSQANAAKDKFFAIVAHDLRGPIGSLAVLFNDVITSRKDLTDELLKIVRASTNSTSKFLEELLTWARSQRGEIDCNPEAFDIGQVLMETQALFSAQAQAKGVHLDMNIEEHCWVFADLAMTHAILRNLTSNALKFTQSGGSVSVRFGREKNRCLVRITDTGIGMSEEMQQSLFRLDVKPQSLRGTHNEPGTGLGLILCREFVEKIGGAIGVQSQQGEGSTFWFTLPIAKESEIVDPQAILKKIRSLKVLVAEDDKLHREASAQVLRELGCASIFASDGAEATWLALKNDFDLILMDIDMPQVDGIEATKRIRANGNRSRIVSLSSYSRQELNQLAQEVQFDGYLDKPLAREALIRVLAGFLGHSASA